jgi:hypothetical protein
VEGGKEGGRVEGVCVCVRGWSVSVCVCKEIDSTHTYMLEKNRVEVGREIK